MSGLALYFETEGLATVAIALVREHAQRMKPPRALWVPYPLGRPFGVPNDAKLQRRIIEAALALLDRPSGPVLEDFPDLPAKSEAGDQTPWVCPVSFPAPPPDPDDRVTPLLDEIRALAPWYDRAREQRGRTTVGLSGRSVGHAAEWLAALAEGKEALSAPQAAEIRWCADDLKAYYLEAATAQTGLDAYGEFEPWFWQETQAARLLQDLRRRCLAQEDVALRDLGNFMLVPSTHI